MSNQLEANRFSALDGWRGLSILFVLAAHMLPLGPKSWQLNFTAGVIGMSIFFTLSGFLITSFFIKNSSIVDFFIRRLFRILPLAWLYIVLAMILSKATFGMWLANLLFIANWPPMQLVEVGGHLWSLCVEVQFYICIALLFALLRHRGLLLLPLLGLGITLFRIDNGVHVAINTYFRVDEILAGSTLALVYFNKFGDLPRKIISGFNPWVVLVLLLVSSHPDSGFMNYLRPYLAGILVGITITKKNESMSTYLNNRWLIYLAAISYALYVIHPLLMYSWLGSGDVFERYAKRPLLFIVLWMLAHFSTYYYEHKCISYGKSLSKRLQRGTVSGIRREEQG